jgi:hypothetical protein
MTSLSAFAFTFAIAIVTAFHAISTASSNQSRFTPWAN